METDGKRAAVITTYLISREESTWGLPDGQYAVHFIAVGYGDDTSDGLPLYNTWSLDEDACRDLARAWYPQAACIGRELPVMSDAWPREPFDLIMQGEDQ